MIAYIKGTLVNFGPEYIIVDNKGIGYKVFVSPNYQRDLPQVGEEIKVYTYQYVREDKLLLYGFKLPDDVALFELLLTVSGIGPKGAFTIAGSIPAAEFYLSVINEDIQNLLKVPGVGKKSARRIILELKEKIEEIKKDLGEIALVEGEGVPDIYREVVEALSALGYGQQESQEAVSFLRREGYGNESLEENLRLALKYLAGI